MSRWIKTIVCVLLNAMVVAIASAGFSAALAQEKSITVLVWGVTWQSAISSVSEEYTKKTGVKVNFVTEASSGEGLVKLQVMRAQPTVDVWFTTASVADRAASDGELLARLPKDKISNLAMLAPGFVSDKYVAVYTYPLSIIYRTDLVDKPITGWQDLWQPRFAGKLAVPSMGMYQARMLAIAAAVNGGSTTDADKGFEMLAKLKPNVAVFYGSDAQARQALAQGEVSVLVAPPSQAKRMEDAGVPIKILSPKGSPMNADVVTIVHGGQEATAADYINFLLEKTSNEAIAKSLNMGAVNRESKQPASLADALPKAGDEIVLDEGFINKNIGAWTDRFNRDIVR
jgi:putative spermidine/putrescine transport system substrate-binding protein